MLISQEMREKLTCENAGDLTPEQFYDVIINAIKDEMPYLSHAGKPLVSIMPILDYGMRSAFCRWKKLSDITGLEEGVRVIVNENPGGSEGIYLDVSVETWDPEGIESLHTPLFIFKTLEETPDAYAAMGALGGMVMYAVELFLIVNM